MTQAHLPLVLCEHATFHPDGTYTVVKGGITYWRTPLPLELTTVGFIQVARDTIPVGESVLTIQVLDADGTVLEEQSGTVTTAASSAAVTYLAVRLHAIVQRYGIVRIVVGIGNVTWSAELEIKPQGEP